MKELEFPLADLLTALGFVVTITAYIVNSRISAKALGGRLEMIDATMENFREELKAMQSVMSQQAVQTERLNNQDQRMLLEGKRLDRMEEILFKLPRMGDD